MYGGRTSAVCSLTFKGQVGVWICRSSPQFFLVVPGRHILGLRHRRRRNSLLNVVIDEDFTVKDMLTDVGSEPAME